jgi:drug/metabolite transporter (DMT)-like permease
VTAPARHVWAALLVVYFVWGSTYLGIKVVVETLPPLISAGSRFLTAGAVLTLVLVLRGRSLRVTRRELLSTSLVGLLLLTFGVGIVHVAELRIDSSVAAMIAGTVPLQVVLLRTAARDRVRRSMRLATLVGLVGLVFVLAPGFDAESTAVGLVVMVGATASWSFGSFLSPRLTLPRDPFVASAYEMVVGGTILVLASLVVGEWSDLDGAAFAADSVAAWIYLVLAGSLIGFTAYAWLLRSAPISLVVTHQYVNPLVAIALGMLVLDERPSPLALVGAALVVGAVYATVRAESPAKPRERAPIGPEPATKRV